MQLTTESLGSVLIAMANQARRSADREGNRGHGNNQDLLYHLSFIFQGGAERCLELSKEDEQYTVS